MWVLSYFNDAQQVKSFVNGGLEGGSYFGGGGYTGGAFYLRKLTLVKNNIPDTVNVEYFNGDGGSSFVHERATNVAMRVGNKGQGSVTIQLVSIP